LKAYFILKPLQIAKRQQGFIVCEDPIVVKSVTMSKRFKKSSLKMPSLEEDHLITAAAESKPDALPLKDDQISAMVPMRVLGGCPKLAN
jgi:hypothetical protein